MTGRVCCGRPSVSGRQSRVSGQSGCNLCSCFEVSSCRSTVVGPFDEGVDGSADN